MRLGKLEIAIGGIVLYEHNYKYYPAEILRIAEVADHDADIGNGLVEVRPLQGWFRRPRWVKAYNIVGKLPRP